LKSFNVIASARSACAAGIACCLVACAAPESSPRAERGEDDQPASSLQLRSGVHRLEAPASGVVTDACPGAGSARVLARLGIGATCESLLGSLAEAASDVTAAYQFADAPPDVQERFCVFESPSLGVSVVPDLLDVLRSGDDVQLGLHDCSSDPLVPSPIDPDAYVAPAGSVASSAPATSHDLEMARRREISANDAQPDGTHSCDTCAIASCGDLYVNVPLSMTPPSDATMVVRFLDTGTDDRTIVAPGGAQSFVVPGFGVQNTTPVRIYGPGENPPPK
jgi:hypothetical protein